MWTALTSAPAHAITPQGTMQPGSLIQAEPSIPGIFGALELRTNAARGAERWPEVMARATSERREWLACERGSKDCPPRLKAWRDGLAKARDLTRWQQIVEVNRLVNSLVRFRNDIDRYGVSDYWATPKEALSKSGDCEDYAILKYLSLRELGFEDADMRMVVVKITRRGIGHAVLAVNHDGGRYILDNLNEKPVEHSVVKGYRPVYSVNARGQWLALQVKPVTTQIASLEPALPLSVVSVEPIETPAVEVKDQGLKLPDESLLASEWAQLSAVEPSFASWNYVLFSLITYAAANKSGYPAPEI